MPLIFSTSPTFWRDEALPAYLAAINRWRTLDPAAATDGELLAGIRDLARADATYWWATALVIGGAKVSDAIFSHVLALTAPERGLTSGMFLRGFPSKLVQADAELEEIAARIRVDDALRKLVKATPAPNLLATLAASPAGRDTLDDLGAYFARYGHQIYTLDFAEPTLEDDPLPVLLSLKAMVARPGQGALARQAEMASERDRLVAALEHELNPLRRFLFRRVLRWAQRLAPGRDEAFFYVGAAWPTLRRLALELGQRLANAGFLDAADDIFFLESAEIVDASSARITGEDRRFLATEARSRRELREARKRLHPPAAVPPDYRYRIGPFDMSGFETQRRNLLEGPTLSGFAVSPGRVTAPASVIRSPADFGEMEPGTILVCPTTTPAWTPLFSQARGLITDIGGVLAHGSIVAREYGIPAVMGTGNATQRITSGQVVTVDGDAGIVTLLP
jgi:pyruvate,water dikinase